MTNAAIYLRAAERIDSGRFGLMLGDFVPEHPRVRLLMLFRPSDASYNESWTRETRVLALCFMAAMERAK